MCSDVYANVQQRLHSTHKDTHSSIPGWRSPAFLPVFSALISWPHSEPQTNEQRITSRMQHWGEITLLFATDCYYRSLSVSACAAHMFFLSSPCNNARDDHPVQSKQWVCWGGRLHSGMLKQCDHWGGFQAVRERSDQLQSARSPLNKPPADPHFNDSKTLQTRMRFNDLYMRISCTTQCFPYKPHMNTHTTCKGILWWPANLPSPSRCGLLSSRRMWAFC